MKIFKSAMLGAAALSVACMPAVAAANEAQKLSLSGASVRTGATVKKGSHAGGGFKWYWVVAVLGGIAGAVIIATDNPKPDSP
jgi:hypothetical protein